MSGAPAAAPAEGEAPKKGNKKLIIIIAAVAVLLLGGGGAAFFIMKKKAAEAEAAAADGEDGGEEHAPAGKVAKKPEGGHGKDDKHVAPTFVPLDPFIVNLADKENERYAQIGLSLQVDDPHLAEEMKAYMPAIRNAILLILSHKTSDEILTSDGKQDMAEEIRREAARAMGYHIEDPDEEDDNPSKKKKKRKKVESYNPIVSVAYSSFIVQ